jgi:hypothetical protein
MAVGRALVHSILRGKELTRNVTVPVSAGLLADIGCYFAALIDYRRGRPEPIILLTAEVSFAAVDNGHPLVVDLRAARRKWDSLMPVCSRRSPGTRETASKQRKTFWMPWMVSPFGPGDATRG